MDELLTYQVMTEDLNDIINGMKRCGPFTASGLEHIYLDFDENNIKECERFNIILPLMKWQADNQVITELVKGEIEWYYREYTEGRLEPLLQDYEKDVVLHDFLECYHKVFG